MTLFTGSLPEIGQSVATESGSCRGLSAGGNGVSFGGDENVLEH